MVRLGILTTAGEPTFKESKKMKSGAYMDLNLDFLISTEKGVVIAMAHNYKQNGDVMADPDMEIRTVKNLKMFEALSFKQDSTGTYQQVYTDETETILNPQIKKDLNIFLNTWLNNLIAQGFSGSGQHSPVTEGVS